MATSDMQRFVELAGVRPDRHAMLRWLADNVRVEDIETVAAAACGDELADNRRALRRILDEQRIPNPIDVGESWLHEACWMTIHGDATAARTPSEHRPLALAMTILVLAYAPGEALHDYGFAVGSASAVLVRAARALGPDAVAACTAMLADLCVRYEPDDTDEPENLFFAFGVLALLDEPRPAAVELLLSCEQRLSAGSIGRSSDLWLYRLTYFDGFRDVCREELLGLARRTPPPAGERLAALVEPWPPSR